MNVSGVPSKLEGLEVVMTMSLKHAHHCKVSWLSSAPSCLWKEMKKQDRAAPRRGSHGQQQKEETKLKNVPHHLLIPVIPLNEKSHHHLNNCDNNLCFVTVTLSLCKSGCYQDWPQWKCSCSHKHILVLGSLLNAYLFSNLLSGNNSIHVHFFIISKV